MTQTETHNLDIDEQAFSYVSGAFSRIKNDRVQVDYDNYVNELYYRGKHFSKWNRFNKSEETPPAKKGEVRIPIPIAKDIVQRTLLEVTKENPVFNVMPESNEDDDLKKAKWADMLLDAVYDKSGLKKKIKQVVLHGLKFSVGIWEVIWDPEAENGEGEVDVRVVDPNDFYIGLNFEDPADSPIIIKTLRKDYEYIKNSDIYKAKRKNFLTDLVPDDEVTDNSFRRQVLGATHGNFESGRQGESPHGTVLVNECWVKYYPKGEITPKYRIISYTVKQGLVIRNEKTDETEPPFLVYHTDQNPGEFYGEGNLKHLVPLNRAVDMLENRMLEYHHKFIKGQYIVDRGADIKTVTNESGQIIYKNPGRAFDVPNVPPIPPTSRDQVASFQTYAQDTGGIHAASLGRPEKGVEGARAIEGLIQADVSSKSDLRDNLVIFLEDSGRKILKVISENYTNKRLVRVYDGGEMKSFSAIGESSDNPEKESLSDTVMIRPENDVKVKIGSGLGETPEARKQAAGELLSMGAIPLEEFLKTWGYASVKDVAEKAWQDRERVKELEKDQPPQKTTKDYINTKFSDLERSEQDQLLGEYGIQPGQEPRPGSVEGQAELAESKMVAQLQNDLSKQGHASELGGLQAEEDSLNPLIGGGAVDLTQEAAMKQAEMEQKLMQQGESNGQQPASPAYA